MKASHDCICRAGSVDSIIATLFGGLKNGLPLPASITVVITPAVTFLAAMFSLFIALYAERLRNDSIFPKAVFGVRAYILKSDEFRQGGYLTLWDEQLPLTIRREALHSPRRQVDRPLNSDFFYVRNNPPEIGLLVFAVINPPRNAKLYFDGEVQLRVSVFADSIEGESSVETFEIRWDGKWNSGNDEMATRRRVTTSST